MVFAAEAVGLEGEGFVGGQALDHDFVADDLAVLDADCAAAGLAVFASGERQDGLFGDAEFGELFAGGGGEEFRREVSASMFETLMTTSRLRRAVAGTSPRTCGTPTCNAVSPNRSVFPARLNSGATSPSGTRIVSELQGLSDKSRSPTC